MTPAELVRISVAELEAAEAGLETAGVEAEWVTARALVSIAATLIRMSGPAATAAPSVVLERDARRAAGVAEYDVDEMVADRQEIWANDPDAPGRRDLRDARD